MTNQIELPPRCERNNFDLFDLKVAAIAFHLRQFNPDASPYYQFVPVATNQNEMTIYLDKHTGNAYCGGKIMRDEKPLSRTKMWILLYLMANSHRRVNIDELADRIHEFKVHNYLEKKEENERSYHSNNIRGLRKWLVEFSGRRTIINAQWGVGYEYNLGQSGLLDKEREIAIAAASGAVEVLGNDHLARSMVNIRSMRHSLPDGIVCRDGQTVFDAIQKLTLVPGLYEIDIDGQAILGSNEKFPMDDPTDFKSFLALYGAGGEVLTPYVWEKMAGVRVDGDSCKNAQHRFRNLQLFLSGINPGLPDLIESVRFGYRFKAEEYGPLTPLPSVISVSYLPLSSTAVINRV